MSYKISTGSQPVRRYAALYTIGRIALLFMALLTLADLVRVYLSYGTSVAVGMMIPRMGVMLGIGGTGAAAVICQVCAYVFFLGAIVFALLAGRQYGWSVAALVLFSVDTLVALWLYFAAHGVGFLPSLVLHILVEAFLIVAVVVGRRLGKTDCGVRGALRFMLSGRISEKAERQ